MAPIDVRWDFRRARAATTTGHHTVTGAGPQGNSDLTMLSDDKHRILNVDHGG
jgi:hypothetical protein